jgi:hypothetical protein
MKRKIYPRYPEPVGSTRFWPCGAEGPRSGVGGMVSAANGGCHANSPRVVPLRQLARGRLVESEKPGAFARCAF